MRNCHFRDTSLARSRDSCVTCSASRFPIIACVSLNSASFISTLCSKSTNSSYHGWVTFKNSVSSSCNFYNCIFSFLLLPNCTIRCIGVRPKVSSFNFTISASAYHISSHTCSNTSICSMPNNDYVAVSSKCVVFAIWCAIYLSILLADAFNCSVGSLFSNSSILALYSTSTMSILTTCAYARPTTFYTFSNMEAMGSSYMFGSSEHNSAIDLFMLTSSCFLYIANVVAL